MGTLGSGCCPCGDRGGCGGDRVAGGVGEGAVGVGGSVGVGGLAAVAAAAAAAAAGAGLAADAAGGGSAGAGDESGDGPHAESGAGPGVGILAAVVKAGRLLLLRLGEKVQVVQVWVLRTIPSRQQGSEIDRRHPARGHKGRGIHSLSWTPQSRTLCVHMQH